jgi:hypothetical protein
MRAEGTIFRGETGALRRLLADCGQLEETVAPSVDVDPDHGGAPRSGEGAETAETGPKRLTEVRRVEEPEKPLVHHLVEIAEEAQRYVPVLRGGDFARELDLFQAVGQGDSHLVGQGCGDENPA